MSESVIWIVVANGASARIFDWPDASGPLREIWADASDEARKPTRELGSERPGREQAAPGTARHGFAPPADWHEAAKADFVAALADKLNVAAEKGRFAKLALFAAPKALGQLREGLSGKAAGCIIAERDKDWTHVPAHELRKLLADGKEFSVTRDA